MNENEAEQRILGRRALLRSAGALSVGAVAGGSVVSAARPLPSPYPAGAPAALPRVLTSSCTLTATQTPGPFYVSGTLVRQDITEGLPGLDHWLIYQVVDAATCQPIQGAAVDAWHTDALGSYSGFASEGTAGQTFMRGIQFTDANGLVFFKTVYPGWYPVRTPHVHLKVRPTPTSELTTQMYYPDFISAAVYQYFPPYSTRGVNPVTNALDGGYRPDLEQITILAPDGTLALWSGLIIAVQ